MALRGGDTSNTSREGIGLGNQGDPAFTLQAAHQHAVAFHENQRGELSISETAGSLKVGGGKPGQGYPAIAFEPRYYTRDNRTGGVPNDVATLKADASKAGDGSPQVRTDLQVRRLTPMECERLQGFPDRYTELPYRGKHPADGPRYKALGNSMAVPVMRWLGQRIDAVDALSEAS